ncbi:MAG TPA: hypothetical protein VJ792_00155 [Candidatus Nitrosotalea sp.]|nr:hypothetical protein [Candidatus Nitrosotalea sp.]
MIWPGMGDPSKRRKTLRYLAITAAIGIGVALANTLVVQKIIKADDPLYQCINGRDIKYQLSATLEIDVDGVKQAIPANVGITNNCQRSLYTLSDDGVIHAGWTKEYPFEVGHFLWLMGFDLRDMDESKSKIYVNGVESPNYIHTLLEDGAHYKADFVSKDNGQGAPTFTPPK